jgi:hypothetical protein
MARYTRLTGRAGLFFDIPLILSHEAKLETDRRYNKTGLADGDTYFNCPPLELSIDQVEKQPAGRQFFIRCKTDVKSFQCQVFKKVA